MKIKLIPSTDIKVEIDGKIMPGTFRLESEWNGLLKLESPGPVQRIIVRQPPRPKNPWDFISHIFGGGQSPKSIEAVEVEVVSHDFHPNELPPAVANKSPVDLTGSGRFG